MADCVEKFIPLELSDAVKWNNYTERHTKSAIFVGVKRDDLDIKHETHGPVHVGRRARRKPDPVFRVSWGLNHFFTF